MFRQYISKMLELVQELKWALLLEADEDMLRDSKEGRDLRAYLKKLEKRVMKMRRICDKIEPEAYRKARRLI